MVVPRHVWQRLRRECSTPLVYRGPGIDAFLANDVQWLLEQKARVIVSIAGETIEEYATLARKLRSISGISAVEVNISCPNVENRGLVFACDPDASRRVIDGGA